jgi:hypothetical protein
MLLVRSEDMVYDFIKYGKPQSKVHLFALIRTEIW